MRFTLNIAGLALLLLGLLWLLQGLNLIGGSFMTGQPEWVLIGAAIGGVGTGILVWANFRRGWLR